MWFFELSPQIILLQTKSSRQRRNKKSQNLKEGGRKSRIAQDCPFHWSLFLLSSELVRSCHCIFFIWTSSCKSNFLSSVILLPIVFGGFHTERSRNCFHHVRHDPPENDQRLWFVYGFGAQNHKRCLWFLAQNYRQCLWKTINAASSECFPTT